MEARRLAILCSHLCPVNLGSSPAPLLNLSSSSCASGSKSEHLIYDSQKGSLQDDCVFCKIIRGEAPAFKVLILSIQNNDCGKIIREVHSKDLVPPSYIGQSPKSFREAQISFS